MILILVTEVTPRIKYIFELIFDQILTAPYKLVTDKIEFDQYESIKFRYGVNHSGDTLFFAASPLLFEKTVRNQRQNIENYKKTGIMYPVKDGALPFDPFAASFYMVTRYEEYLPHIKDKHDRFQAEEGFSFKANVLEKPIVNIWAWEIAKIISDKTGHTFHKSTFQFTPIIEVSKAYQIKFKGYFKSSALLGLRFVTFKFKDFWKRIMVHTNFQSDPFDSFAEILYQSKRFNVKPVFLFLSGKSSHLDNNISIKHEKSSILLEKFKQAGTVGLLVSYRGAKDLKTLEVERAAIENAAGIKIKSAKVHYNRLYFPETYQKMSDAGITEDYTMEFPTKAGFRAGICTPFNFYNLEYETQTALKINPVIFSDRVLKFKMQYASSEVLGAISVLVREVAEVGGHLNYIFHNESLGKNKIWKNWNGVYEKVIKICIKNQK